jgi:uncharacterized protein YukE
MSGPTPPAEISVDDVWDLHARPDLIDQAASGWRQVSSAITKATADLDAKAKAVVGSGWSGEAAETFDAHRRKLTTDLDDTADQAVAVAAALGKIAGSIGAAQGHLTDEWGKVTAVPLTYDRPMHLLFAPRTTDESKLVIGSVEACGQIRQGLDRQLGADLSGLWKVRAEFQRLAAVWLTQAQGKADPFTLPPEATATGVIYDGNHVFVNTGPGDDKVSITVDPKTGMQLVTVNGVQYAYPPGADIIVRAGGGDDSITVAPGTNLHVTLIGGKGDDEIHGGAGNDTVLGLSGQDKLYGSGGADRISAGADRDYVDGGAGNDVLSGGLGDDTVYGLSGNDALSGGEGQDYLEGATGNDTVDGGAGNDIVSGGRDDDTMRGGAGDDKIYAGLGHDTSDGGGGADTVFGEKGDVSTGAEQNVTVEIKDPGTFINVEGSDEFKERVNADLDMMRSSPRGQEMLAALDKGHADTEGGWGPWHHDGDSLTIREYNDPQDPNNSTAVHSGRSNVINYNPHLDNLPLNHGASTVDGPPSVVLYHEMAHVYDYMNDSLAPGDYQGPDNPDTPNREREAAGLPLEDGKIYDKHPYDLTENGLRDEMGAPHRDAY